ncbi:DUF3667 domain-containing protein [Luteimonas sp. BDR2-5]|uniref:DUF3667 domain-containing protein n=1 Tax=Proluteimonas luteida TaxID=2878685 RepID=UPI001E3FE926|nr:DUF3667 domain-containing protein [Luteimonas sp. BDR2-5]MCD9027255.1 DUF3667 domain-containing protein [Luteimonas sp. BDR2-5]
MSGDDATRPPAADAAPPPEVPWWRSGICRNCGAPMHGAPYCSQCGQKAAHRLGIGDLRKETWEKWRLFELSVARTLGRLLLRPGTVAREYVEGARSRHVHPLKLLLVCIALLVVLLGRIGFMTSPDADVNAAMALAQRYGKWSFTLGIFAIVATTLLVFRRRGGFNPVEHLVLAAYCHAAMIVLNFVNLLPLLVLDTSAYMLAWREASKWYMYVVECALLAFACVQFFRLDLRRDAWRLLLAMGCFVAIDLILLRAYSELIVAIVLARLA